MDLSNTLKGVFFRDKGKWHTETVGGLLEKSDVISSMLAECGYLEIWEWEEAQAHGSKISRCL